MFGQPAIARDIKRYIYVEASPVIQGFEMGGFFRSTTVPFRTELIFIQRKCDFQCRQDRLSHPGLNTRTRLAVLPGPAASAPFFRYLVPISRLSKLELSAVSIYITQIVCYANMNVRYVDGSKRLIARLPICRKKSKRQRRGGSEYRWTC